jgi:hypothetical protein
MEMIGTGEVRIGVDGEDGAATGPDRVFTGADGVMARPEGLDGSDGAATGPVGVFTGTDGLMARPDGV